MLSAFAAEIFLPFVQSILLIPELTLKIGTLTIYHTSSKILKKSISLPVDMSNEILDEW